MKTDAEINSDADLAFFGRINASISHELKNILAIISEASGLLRDLTDMSGQDNPPDMEMFKSCSRDIEEEIQRGFATIRAMNTFSHSVDESIASVSPLALVNLMVNISNYLSYACPVKVDAPDPADLQITTCAFRLQQLIYLSLVFAYRISGPEGEITVSVREEGDGDVRISFANLGDQGDAEFPLAEMNAIARSIQAVIRAVDDFQSFDIIVPQAIKDLP
jgi:signal transduction histidine kinase